MYNAHFQNPKGLRIRNAIHIKLIPLMGMKIATFESIHIHVDSKTFSATTDYAVHFMHGHQTSSSTWIPHSMA